MSDSATVTVRLTGSAEEHHEIGSYPRPPAAFALDPHVEALLIHVRAYRDGRERLSDGAYFIYTYLTKVLTPNRRSAAQALAVEERVLRKLSELSSTVGDVATARKIDSQWQKRPFTAAEISWVEAVFAALIRRVGAIAAGVSPPPLAMLDLPQV